MVPKQRADCQQQEDTVTDIILDEAPASMEVEEHPSVHDC